MLLITDTNFLVYCAKYRILYKIEELNAKLLLPRQVLLELELLSKKARKSSDRNAASLALEFISGLRKEGKIIIKNMPEHDADDAVLNLALENKNNEVLVATHDRELMKRLKKAKINLIGVRQNKYLSEK